MRKKKEEDRKIFAVVKKKKPLNFSLFDAIEDDGKKPQNESKWNVLKEIFRENNPDHVQFVVERNGNMENIIDELLDTEALIEQRIQSRFNSIRSPTANWQEDIVKLDSNIGEVQELTELLAQLEHKKTTPAEHITSYFTVQEDVPLLQDITIGAKIGQGNFSRYFHEASHLCR
jgi:hypothetical protein